MQAGSDRVARIMAATAAVLAGTVADAEPQARERLAAEIGARLEALTGERIFADLPDALREAELQALQISLAIYEAGLPKGDTGAGRAFHEAAVAFSATELAAVKSARATLGGAKRRRRESAGPAAATLSLAGARRVAEEGLLVELDLAVGVLPLPDRFLALFLDSRRDSSAWFDAFSLYVAWHVRSDTGLQQALLAEPLPALTESGLTMAELLGQVFALAKQTALRIEARLAEAEAVNGSAGETDNREVSAHLRRLPAEIAQRLQVPALAMERAAEALRVGGFDPGRTEDVLLRQAQRLQDLIAAHAPKRASGAAEAAAFAGLISQLEAGDFAAAAATARTLPESGRRARAEAQCLALAADWAGARTLCNRAIELVEPTDARLASSAALDLAEVLSENADAAVAAMAVELYDAVLAVGAVHLQPARLAEACIGAARSALALRKGPRQLKALNASLARIDSLIAERAGRPAPELQARLLCARGDLLHALVGHGADRIEEAEEAFRQALALASAARDIRLTSQLHVRLADALLLKGRGATVEQQQLLRDEAIAELQSAQIARLRARDPLWWCEVKIRTAEVLLTTAGARADEVGLKSGVISAKSALRLLPADLVRDRRMRALTVLGGLLTALAKVEPGRRRADQALSAYEAALASADSVGAAPAWTNLLLRIGSLLVPTPEDADAARIADLIGRYRNGLAAVSSHAPSVHRIERALAEALLADGKRRLDPMPLGEAAALLRKALGTLTREADATNWGQAQMVLADVLREIARLNHDGGALDEAVERLTEVETYAVETQRVSVVGGVRQRLLACKALARTMESQVSRASVPGDPVGHVRRLLQKSG